MIIDAHLHTWDTAAVGIAWLAEAGLPPRAALPDLKDTRQYILVEADADDPYQEADWLAHVAARDPRVYGVIPSVALERPEALQALTRAAALPKVVGIRRLLQDRGLFESAELVRGLQHLAHLNMPFDACVRAAELPALTRLLSQVPELSVVLDHVGKPDVADRQALRQWRHDLTALAALPNVNCKLSGLPAECRDAYELDTMTAEVVETAVTLFGPERCLLGSDYPVSQDKRDWCLRVLALLPADLHHAVAYANAMRIYSRRNEP